MVATNAIAGGATGSAPLRVLAPIVGAIRKRLIGVLHLVVPLLMLALALGLRVGVPSFERYQLDVFDVFQRIEPREYVDAPVRIVDLDDASLERIGQWPWPRTDVAQLLANLANAGASAVALDIVFAEADRTSPARVIPKWPSTPETEALLKNLDTLPDHDAVLADVIGQMGAAGFPVVTGFSLSISASGARPAAKGSFAHSGDDPLRYLPVYRGAVVTLPEVEAAATGNGSFSIEAEADSIIRRVPLLFRYGDDLYPSLAAEVLRVAQGAKTFIVKSSGGSGEQAFGEHTGINHVKIGRIVVPTDAQGRMWIHFTEDVPERRIPAWELFAEDFDTTRIAGNIILIGTSAAGLKDLRATPLNPVMAGVEVHAQAIEQMLLGYFLERPDWADGAEIIYLLLLGLTLIFLLPRLGALWCAVLGVAGIGAAIAASWFAFTELRWLLDPVFPSLVVLLIYLAGSLINYLRSEIERNQVRGAFSRYMSPALVEELARNPEKLVLGGETKDMTLLFADIRGFTAISELFKGDPQGLTRLINRFLTPMTDMILERSGTIDKYMGDCIMAFWNAPLDDTAHGRHACDSALAMFGELTTLNATLKEERESAGELFRPINIGIGLNSGECCVGNMGSEQRFDYSVLGDTVNLAARLEGQSKNYGVGIVIGEATRAEAPEYASLELDLIKVKGKEEAVRIFSLVGDAGHREGEHFAALAERHESMLTAYRGQEWAQARQLLAECRALDGSLDTLYDLYTERLDVFETDPPPVRTGMGYSSPPRSSAVHIAVIAAAAKWCARGKGV